MFRSITLAQLPGNTRRLSRLSLFIRWLLIGIVITFSVIAVIGVHLRWFTTNELPGSLLYRLYDDIFLRLKGYLITQFYPDNALWTLTGIVGLIGLIWLVAALTGLSPLREPHIWLWRIATRQIANFDRLFLLLQAFKRIGFSPFLVRLVALDSWEKMRAELRQTPHNEAEPLLDRLVALLEFALHIEKLIPPERQTPREFVQRWHLTTLIVQRHSDPERFHEHWWLRLDDMRQQLLPARFSDDDQLQQYSAFGWETLLQTMQYIFALSRQPRTSLSGHVTNIKLGENEWQPLYQVLEHLLNQHEQRLTMLRAVYHYGERLLYSEFELNSLTPPLLAPQANATTGQFALQLTAHFAYLTKQSYLLTTYIEMLDSACLMIDTHTTPDLHGWAALLDFRAVPPSNAITYPVEIHDIGAELAESQLAAQAESWHFATGSNQLFQAADFAFVQETHVLSTRRRTGDKV